MAKNNIKEYGEKRRKETIKRNKIIKKLFQGRGVGEEKISR